MRQEAEDDEQADQAEQGDTAVRAIPLGVSVGALLRCRLRAALRLVGAEPRLDDAVGDEGDHHRQEQDRGDGEPEVRRQPDRRVRVDEMRGIVGELDQDGVERLDQHVDGEGAGDGGKAERQAGERMPPDAQ